VSDWLPFYENVWEVPTYPEVLAVNAHPEELVPLLRSEDMAVARQAAFATTFLKSVPPYLVEPLARTGLQTITLIRAARAKALPNDPDEVTEERACRSSFSGAWRWITPEPRRRAAAFLNRSPPNWSTVRWTKRSSAWRAA